jgi:hypothetical protein
MILSSTSHFLSIELLSAGTIHVYGTYTDHTDTEGTDDNIGVTVSSSGLTTVVSAPALSTQRQIRTLFAKNKGTTSNVVTFSLNRGVPRDVSPSFSLNPGEIAQYTEGLGWKIFLSSGLEKTQESASTNIGIFYPIFKTGTAPEAAGLRYCFAKDAGFPGAFVPGTPGLSGRAIASSTEAGRIPIVNSGSGVLELLSAEFSSTAVCSIVLTDFLWINSGIVVTTTTAQTINSLSLPARDRNGASSGEGVIPAILVTTATTNAGAIANTTISYTNSAGVSGRIGTISSFPATAVIGTLVYFNLQAGDTGVQSIQTITLGTSYGGGAISLVLLRDIFQKNISLANGGNFQTVPISISLKNDSCLILTCIASSTGAMTIIGGLNVRAI